MKKQLYALLALMLLSCALLLCACGSDPCAAGHTAVTDAAVAATCTEPGLTEGSHCSVCNAVITEQVAVPATGHTAGEWVTQIAATCTQKGSRYNACTVCETLLSVEATNAAGHSFGEWTQVTAATCTAQGQKKHTCTVCNVTETAAIPVLPHTNGAPIVDVSPTCTTDGSRHFVCTVCDNIAKVEILSATGHSYGAYTQLSAPTCVNTGLEQAQCSVCEAFGTRTIAALGHTESTWITDFAATCLSDGSQHKECTICDAILQVKLTDQLAHAWTWTETRAATCTSEGEEKATCANCPTVQYRSTATLAHTAGDWITDLPATCLSVGARHRICTVCEGIMDAETVAKGAHTPGNWSVVTAPTASAAGLNAQLCTLCGTPVTTAPTTLSDIMIQQGTPLSLSLSGYRVIYEDTEEGDDTLFQNERGSLISALKATTGLTLSAYADGNISVQAKEILIGETSRPESATALASIDGDGFAIRVINNKIVIVGSNRLFTLVAMQQFRQAYLSQPQAAAKISVHAIAKADHLTSTLLSSSTDASYVFVSDADVDNDPQHMYVGDSWSISNQGYASDSRDCPALLMDTLISTVSARSGLPAAKAVRITDANTANQNGFEVLLGEIDRAESLAFRAELDAHEYGVRITHNKVIITAHNDIGLERALKAFIALYDYATIYADGEMPQGYQYIGAVEDLGWITDFPRPTDSGITLKGSQNNNDKSLQLLYTGVGVNVTSYLSYCTQLQDAGYTLVTQNDNPGGTGSYFRTYRNTRTSHVLYVAYNAYAYESVYSDASRAGDHIQSSKPNTTTVYYPMLDYEQCIRIVSAPLAQAYLPADTLLSKQSYTKICESSVTAVRLIGGVGMSYIIQLEDGRFLIIDGGAQHKSYNNPLILYNTLTELYKKAHSGNAPTTSSPIHIAAWYITHSHSDHWDVATKFLSSYGKTGLLKMDYLVGNFPEISSVYAVGSDTLTMGNGTHMESMQKSITGGFQYIKVHTGQTLYLANLKMEVLMTYEDHLPNRITNSNDTNTVTKLTLSNSTKDVTWTVLGDSCIYQSRWLCAMWGGTYNSSTGLYDNSYLKADMVQLAHHGNIGCEIAIYKTIQPVAVWFPNIASEYNRYTTNGTATWPFNVDYYVCRTLPTVEYIITSGVSGSAYTDSVTLELTFTAGALDYTTFWGIKSGQSGQFTISYSATLTNPNSPVIKKSDVA